MKESPPAAEVPGVEHGRRRFYGRRPLVSLTPKQQRFVEEYLKDLNATAAYHRAGYKAKPGRSNENAASQLLGNIGVREAIAVAKAKRSKRTEVTADWVVRKLVRNRKRADDAEEYSAVNKSLELLGKHVGMFTDKHEISGPGGTAVPITCVEIVRPEKPADASTAH